MLLNCKCNVTVQHCIVCFKHTCLPCAEKIEDFVKCKGSECHQPEILIKKSSLKKPSLTEVPKAMRTPTGEGKRQQKTPSQSLSHCRKRDCEVCRETYQSAGRAEIDFCTVCTKMKSGESLGGHGCTKRQECKTKVKEKDNVKRKPDESPPIKNPNKQIKGNFDGEGSVTEKLQDRKQSDDN